MGQRAEGQLQGISASKQRGVLLFPGYTDPQELTAELLNDLIDRIVVRAPDRSSGKRRQKIELFYKAAGIIDMFDEGECIAEDGRSQWRKSRQTA